MAASMLCRRTAALCGSFKKVPSPCCGVLLQTASYNPKPLWLNITKPYIPDRDSEKTPEWQKTAHYDAKLYGRYGSASGVDPTKLWPSHGRLEKIIAEETEWQPTLETMLENIKLKEKELAKKRLEKERIIAANMANMPKMVADWRREKREAKRKLKEEKARRDSLLAQARERFGYAVDPRSIKFKEMVKEIEKEEKKKKKMMKRRLKEEQMAIPVIPPAATSTPATS